MTSRGSSRIGTLALISLALTLAACGGESTGTGDNSELAWVAPHEYDGRYIAFGTPADTSCSNLLVGAFGPNSFDIRIADPALFAVWAFERIDGIDMIESPKGFVDGDTFELSWIHEYRDGDTAGTRHDATWSGSMANGNFEGVLTQQLTFLEDDRTCTVSWDLFATPK